MKDDRDLVLYARHKATLSKLRPSLESNGLEVKIDRLGRRSKGHYQVLAYPFVLVVSGLDKINNEQELLNQLGQEFSWKDKEGFARGEAGKRQEVSNGPRKKGDWLPRKSNKKRFAERQ